MHRRKYKKYSKKYKEALTSQTNIGWRHIFMGRLSQEWLTIQAIPQTMTSIKNHTFGHHLLEISIKKFMELWEQQNTDVHGKTEVQEQSRRLRIILHSVATATKAAVTKTKNILKWFKPVNPEGLKRIQKWRRDELVHDAFFEKEETKIEKHGCTNTV